MGHMGDNVHIYDYPYDYLLPVNPETAQTYLAYYPVMELNLNELQYDVNGFPLPDSLPSNIAHTGIEYLLESEYQIKPSLTNFLGKDVTLKKVQGYIYVSNIGNNSTVSLSYSNAENTDKSIIKDSPLQSLSEGEHPKFPKTTEDPFVGEVPEHSIKNEPYIDLTEILNADSTATLKIQIKIPLSEINSSVINKVIHADMAIKLPLIFKVSNPSSRSGYVKLEMNDILPQLGENDLFGRTGNGNDIFNYIEYVKIYLTDHKNTILKSENENDNISILVTSGTYNDLFDFGMPKPVIKIDSDIPYPFSPRFEFLLRKDKGMDFATLKIKRSTPEEPPVFDFCISVEAKTDLSYTLTP
jgi:hypothetical protein